jgi:3-oxoacyl-ACP reductase-like protein
VRWTMAVLIAVILPLSACGESEPSASDQPSSDDVKPTERTTARGLAAAVIEHLPAGSVTEAAGESRDGVSTVLIDLAGEGVTTVYADVQQPSQALSRVLDECGIDSGYEQVTCQTEPALLEVVRQRGDGSSADIIGRYYDEQRGAVLIQTWGSAGDEAQRMVAALLNDALIGVRTSEARNLAGKKLADFGELHTEIRLQQTTRAASAHRHE